MILIKKNVNQKLTFFQCPPCKGGPAFLTVDSTVLGDSSSSLHKAYNVHASTSTPYKRCHSDCARRPLTGVFAISTQMAAMDRGQAGMVVHWWTGLVLLQAVSCQHSERTRDCKPRQSKGRARARPCDLVTRTQLAARTLLGVAGTSHLRTLECAYFGRVCRRQERPTTEVAEVTEPRTCENRRASRRHLREKGRDIQETVRPPTAPADSAGLAVQKQCSMLALAGKFGDESAYPRNRTTQPPAVFS